MRKDYTTVLENQSNESIPVKKSNKLRNRLIGGGVIAAVVVGAGVIGIGNINNGEKPAEVPATSAPVDPTEETPVETENPETPASPELPVESLEIQAGLEPHELAETLINDRFNQWMNIGSAGGSALQEEWRSFAGSDEEILGPVADTASDKFSDALFVEDWRDN